MRYMIPLLLTVGLLADHPHVTRVRVVPTQNYIEWDTASVSDDETTEKKSKSCSVLYRAAVMSCGADERTFDKREGWVVRELLRAVLTFIGEQLSYAAPEIGWIEWLPFEGTGRVHIIAGKSYKFDSDGSWGVVGADGDTSEDATLPEDASFLFNYYSARVVKYCMESTLWWDQGQGEPVKKQRAGE